MTFDPLSRRRLLQGTAALTVATAVPLRAAFAKETTIGFIYVGSRDDYGYNQAHAQGAAALKKLPDIKVVEEEKVPETDAIEKTMESMINLDGDRLGHLLFLDHLHARHLLHDGRGLGMGLVVAVVVARPDIDEADHHRLLRRRLTAKAKRGRPRGAAQ